MPLNNATSRESLHSVSATNPGDGTRRLYGEDTFINNGSDIIGVHPDAVPHTQKPKVKAGIPNVPDDLEPYTYLEDTEARGYVNYFL